MKNTPLFIVAIIILILGYFFFVRNNGDESDTSMVMPSSGEEANLDRHVMAGGEVSFGRPQDFNLAVSGEPLMVSSVIPPCDQGFEYCLYYKGDDYKGTNFESAGLRLGRRQDLESEKDCLNTPPQGYDMAPTASSSQPAYATSVFSHLGDAAAGHYATGILYRLWSGSSCYEFETRVAESQFANYPEGSIQKFTDEDRANAQTKLKAVLGNVRIVSMEDAVIF